MVSSLVWTRGLVWCLSRSRNRVGVLDDITRCSHEGGVGKAILDAREDRGRYGPGRGHDLLAGLGIDPRRYRPLPRPSRQHNTKLVPARSSVGRDGSLDDAKRHARTQTGRVTAPPRLLPMLAGGNGIPTNPEAHQLEPKLDGQRILVTVEPTCVTVTNRRGGEISSYPELAGLADALAPHAAVLDGEVVTFNEKGQTSFQRLQRRMHVAQPNIDLLTEVPAVFVAFDILWLDDEWIIGCPQHERTRILRTLGVSGPAWQTAPILDATPAELVEACRDLGLEGFMAKRLDAPYEPGKRSPAWSKIKCGRRREFVVGGWSTGHGSRQTSIGSLALGCYDLTPAEAEQRGRPQRLFYVGQAGSGLNEDMIRQLARLFSQIELTEPALVNPPRLVLHWVQPLLVVEIAYTEVTEAGTLRQPSIKGLRTDVIASEVTWDEEIADRFAETLKQPPGPA